MNFSTPIFHFLFLFSLSFFSLTLSSCSHHSEKPHFLKEAHGPEQLKQRFEEISDFQVKMKKDAQIESHPFFKYQGRKEEKNIKMAKIYFQEYLKLLTKFLNDFKKDSQNSEQYLKLLHKYKGAKNFLKTLKEN